jgi:hypothetical protein
MVRKGELPLQMPLVFLAAIDANARIIGDPSDAKQYRQIARSSALGPP